MAIVETAQAKVAAKAPSRAAELDRFRLRGFVESLA